VSLPHPEIFAALEAGADILIDDGRTRLQVKAHGPDWADTVVTQAGVVSDRKGVNLPGVILGLSPLTPKDRDDLAFALELGVDWVALSFVQQPGDMAELREIVQGRAACLAKIEKPRALERLDEILDLCDGVMVARGDLGVELSLAQVPAVQKDVIERCNRARVPVITATEMLESMVTSNRPTRAEASDVANAIWDGTDAVMLSQETSIGAHPVDAVRAMARICQAAESHPAYLRSREIRPEHGSTGAAMAHAAAAIADQVGARAILAFTESGATARRVSKARPAVPVIAASPHVEVLRRTALYAGVVPLEVAHGADTDDMIAKGTSAAVAAGLVRPGDRIAFVAGVPVGEPGQTNLVKVEVVR
jgi:pyruvate kinase